MTKGDQVDQLFGDDTQQQQQQQNSPFYIVLVDIKHAANEKEIVCVAKPLFSEEHLNYVALSYRWGQLEETIIDTGLGYLAGITAFDLDDFYALCSVMMQEPGLQQMDYVWVDAICVDHNNMEERQATIHYMANIYGHANYILAVPDFHKGYLKEAHQRNPEYLSNIHKYRKTLYHLLHGNVDALIQVDDDFLRSIHAEDNAFRQTLPSERATHDLYSEGNADQWKQVIDEKFKAIGESMDFLMNLVIDWSSRVLVISECFMAEKKNNLKFWFSMMDDADMTHVSFFEFDFDRFSSLPRLLEFKEGHAQSSLITQCYKDKYKEFYATMAYQLRRQTFLEMMLKSKTSKNEDRFYAIMPISEYKNMLVSKDVVTSWHINNMMSVKLKLYEIMNTKDKLLLLFLSGNPRSASGGNRVVFPTFATTTLHFPTFFLRHKPPILKNSDDDASIYNFDLTDKFAITLIPFITTAEGPCLSKLNIKPKAYYLKDDAQHDTLPFQSAGQKTAICKRLQFDDPDLRLDVLCIPFVSDSVMKTKDDFEDDNDDDDGYPRQIYLIGSFEKNKWTLTRMTHSKNVSVEPNWTHHYCNGDTYSAGFDIY